MKKHFSLIRIENKLESLARFLRCSGIVFKSGEEIFAYPENLYNILEKSIGSEGEINVDVLIGDHTDIKAISLDIGELIVIDPSASLEEHALQYYIEELQEEIQFASIFDSMLEANMAISSNLNLNTLLHIVMSLSEEIFNCEVTSVMLLSPDKKELYWEISRGNKSEFFLNKENRVTLPVGQGIGGHVAQTGEPIVVNDVHEDPRWSSQFDKQSGSETRSLMCVPVKFHGEILGVIESINKQAGEFTLRDLRILEILAAQTGGAIENARIYGELEKAYEDLKLLDKAKERIINHLSHELRTPLALISSVFEVVSGEMGAADISRMQRAINRGKRNLNRLLELQIKIDDILNQRSDEDREKLINIIEDAANVVQELSEKNQGEKAEILELISKRIESLYRFEEIHKEKILLDEFLHNVCDEAISLIKNRNPEIHRNIEKGIVLNMDKKILEKVCGGLLKNAIESTPDEGRIEVKAGLKNGKIRIEFHDYGVGITSQNQKMIFGGFFHTQETDYYSSKRPYEFNAGGSGSDLLRIRIFSERFGFSVDFNSTRCKFIPGDTDMCPGIISSCQYVTEKSECFSSGNSIFSITFPESYNPD